MFTSSAALFIALALCGLRRPEEGWLLARTWSLHRRRGARGSFSYFIVPIVLSGVRGIFPGLPRILLRPCVSFNISHAVLRRAASDKRVVLIDVEVASDCEGCLKGVAMRCVLTTSADNPHVPRPKLDLESW